MQIPPKPRQDTLYRDPARDDSPFVFDAAVTEVFSDMINRSVPGYATILGMLGVIAEKYIQADTRIYDLGCSLGGSTLALGQHTPHANCRIIAIDSSDAMVNKCRHNLSTAKLAPEIEVRCEDLRDTPIHDASLVCLNLTLQFVPRSQRDALISKIHRGLKPEGALILVEKTVSEDSDEQAFLTDLHLAFKRANGYTDMEISRKRTALETVLRPDSHSRHLERLRQNGFQHIHRWFSCLGFNAYLAIK